MCINIYIYMYIDIYLELPCTCLALGKPDKMCLKHHHLCTQTLTLSLTHLDVRAHPLVHTYAHKHKNTLWYTHIHTGHWAGGPSAPRSTCIS